MDQLIHLSKAQCEAMGFPKGTRVLVEKPEPPKKWEPPTCWYWSVLDDGDIAQIATADRLEAGNAYPTKEAAEQGRKERIARERLAMRARQIDPDWVPDWNDTQQDKYFILYDHSEKEWLAFGNGLVMERPGETYMSRKTAIQIRDELNSGFLTLEVE